jgi:hypothetical protein
MRRARGAGMRRARGRAFMDRNPLARLYVVSKIFCFSFLGFFRFSFFIGFFYRVVDLFVFFGFSVLFFFVF